MTPWVSRGLRLSVIIGVFCFGWNAWTIFSRYHDDRSKWAEIAYSYRCAARTDEEMLRQHANEHGNFNIRGVYCSSRDFWVSPQELNEVRSGVMTFETSYSPFNLAESAVVGVVGGLSAALLTLMLAGIYVLARWVWGR